METAVQIGKVVLGRSALHRPDAGAAKNTLVKVRIMKGLLSSIAYWWVAPAKDESLTPYL